MRPGYNTNGLNCHRWPDALQLLADTGYQSVALTVDHSCLDPVDSRLPQELAAMRNCLERLRLRSVIETGARFLLNPLQKHEPTLMTPEPEGRAVRVDFLCRCIDIAAELGSDAVSFWAGILREPISRGQGLQRLTEGILRVCEQAERRRVRLAFEPEPGMFIETMAQYAELRQRIDSPWFGLTIDVGHLHCLGEVPISEYLHRHADRLWNIHIEDMRAGVHDHLRFGEGEIDFPPVFRALREIDYQGGLHVELSRHSHMAPEVVQESWEFLQAMLGQSGGS